MALTWRSAKACYEIINIFTLFEHIQFYGKIDEHVQPDTFTSLLYTLLGNVRKSLSQLLEIFKSQFAQDETSIGTTHLTKIQIETGDWELVSQRLYPIAMKHYDWVRNEINKLLDVQLICSSHSSWSAPIIVVPKGNSRKHLVIDYRALYKVMAIPMVCAKGWRHLLKAKWF